MESSQLTTVFLPPSGVFYTIHLAMPIILIGSAKSHTHSDWIAEYCDTSPTVSDIVWIIISLCNKIDQNGFKRCPFNIHRAQSCPAFQHGCSWSWIGPIVSISILYLIWAYLVIHLIISCSTISCSILAVFLPKKLQRLLWYVFCGAGGWGSAYFRWK